MSEKPTVAELRQMLAARFPSSPTRAEAVVSTGVPGLDEPLGGGVPGGAFTEVVCGRSAGGGVVLSAVLAATRAARQRVGLVDATDGFAPDELPPEDLEHLVWARVGRSSSGVRGGAKPLGGAGAVDLKTTWAVADLLVRDGHFALLVLDLRGVEERELLRTPGTTWYRLQRAVEQSGVAGLVLSPTAVVPGARNRFKLESPLRAAAWTVARADLAKELAPELERRRARTRGMSA